MSFLAWRGQPRRAVTLDPVTRPPKRNPEDRRPHGPDEESDGHQAERARARDIAATERDQAADRRDDAATALDEAAGETDRASARSWVRAREQGPKDRAKAASERAELARIRDEAASERQVLARNLERAALESDDAAKRRDRAAEALDEAARKSDLASARHSADDSKRGIDERERGASDRAEAAYDRQVSARDRKHAAEDREASATDELTGARRRGAGLTELDREIDRAERTGGQLAVAFVDIDGLKALNDAHGHQAGDELLIAVSGLLKESLRSYDLVIRVGGDEFVCVLPDMTVAEARERFATIADMLSDGRMGGSIGVGFAQFGPGDSTDSLLARADAELLKGRRGRRR
jgi:diguanylate cyclase (GGDEF)-like protein